MALRITSIFVEKRPILCVTEKKHKKGNPRTGSGIPELIPVKIPIWGSVAANSDITILSILAAM